MAHRNLGINLVEKLRLQIVLYLLQQIIIIICITHAK